MNIPIIDNIIMTSDPHNIILNRKLVYEVGKNKGMEYLQPYAYFPDIVQALEDCVLTKVGESTAKSIKELVREHHELVEYFKELLGTKIKEK